MLTKITSKIKDALSKYHCQFKERSIDILAFNDINLLPFTDWNKITKNELFWSIEYHSALQKGSPKSISFRYLLIYENNVAIAAMYFQLLNLTGRTIKSVLNGEYLSSSLSSMNGLKNHEFGKNQKEYLCIAGNLFVSGNYAIVYRKSESEAYLKYIIKEALQLINKHLKSDESIIATLCKDFSENETRLNNAFKGCGFVGFEIDPEMELVLDKKWNGFEDYLKALSSKYRIRAKNVLKKSNTINVIDLNADQIANYKAQINSLFSSVYSQAPVKLASNNPEYFYYLKTNLKEHFRFKGYFYQGNLIGFSSAFYYNKCLRAHHIGLDYDFNTQLALYQTILYNYIEDAIHLKADRVNFGRDALEIKSTVGAAPVKLKLYIKFANPITQLMLDSFFKISNKKEWTQRRPFKETTLHNVESI